MLAGGAGRRIGGDKPTRELCGRSLISYPLAAIEAAGLQALVVAKPGTDLGDVEAEVLLEPPEPHHPLLGIATALEGRADPIVVCPCDLPLIEPVVLAYLGRLPRSDRPILIESDRGPEPLLGLYPPTSARTLRELALAERPAEEVVHSPGAHRVAITRAGGSERSLLNVNAPEELAQASRLLLGETPH
ncbi:MAG: molybdenum cofactor guanylyltransferase [Solirubrobacterales bacterium]